jgi:hypothetical protein
MARAGSAGPLEEAVSAAAAQIAIVLREAEPSVEQLGASVSRMIVTLGSVAATCAGRDDPELGAAMVELRRDATEATVTLQFYDRMTQNLTHLHDYLAGVAQLLANTSRARADAVPEGPSGEEAAQWHALREHLLLRLVPHARRQPVSTNTIELF